MEHHFQQSQWRSQQWRCPSLSTPHLLLVVRYFCYSPNQFAWIIFSSCIIPYMLVRPGVNHYFLLKQMPCIGHEWAFAGKVCDKQKFERSTLPRVGEELGHEGRGWWNCGHIHCQWTWNSAYHNPNWKHVSCTHHHTIFINRAILELIGTFHWEWVYNDFFWWLSIQYQ